MLTMVLLPGLDGTGLLFDDFVAELGPDFEAIVVRYPRDRALGYAELGVIARASLPGDRPFVLLGESFSGPIAISLAASHPPGLVALILCCSFARYPRWSLRLLRSLARIVPVKGRIVSWLRGMVSPQRISTPLQEKLARVNAQVSAAALRARIRALLQIDTLPLLREVNVPILYLAATGDGVVPFRAYYEICECVPSLRMEKFNSPHFLLQAIPNEAVPVIRDFLRPILKAQWNP